MGGYAALDGRKHGWLAGTLTGKVEAVAADCWGALEIAWLGAWGDVGEGDADAVCCENALGKEEGGS